MRWDLWLAQPNTARGLRAGLRVAGGVFAVWTLAVAYGLWSAGNALETAQVALLSRRKQITATTMDLHQKRAEAAMADRVKTSAPDGPGSAELTDEIARIADAVGAELSAARVGQNDPAAAAAAAGQPGAAAPAANPSAGTPPAATAGPWAKAPFECTVAGRFDALARFLDSFAASPRLVEIASLQVTRANVEAGTGAPRLQMKLMGTLYGLPEKP